MPYQPPRWSARAVRALAAERRRRRRPSSWWYAIDSRATRTGKPAMIRKPALVTTLSSASPQVPWPPSWPGAASATGALSASTQSVRKAVRTMQRGYLSSLSMAVVLASDLAKDMAGEPLLRGVSFKLERRDRLTLSGRNGSGKTTLLRMLSGESGIDGGELVFAKDVRLALHDQRPPRDRDLSLRDYVLGGCKDLLALEEELASLEAEMAAGNMDVLDRYATAQTRLEHAGGYNWRESVNSTLHGLGFRDEHLDRSLETFSG